MACLYDRYEIGKVAEEIIRNKGFSITYHDELEIYLAKNEQGWNFRAETICALLGLITVHEENLDIASDEKLNLYEFSDVLPLIKTQKPNYIAVYEKKK